MHTAAAFISATQFRPSQQNLRLRSLTTITHALLLVALCLWLLAVTGCGGPSTPPVVPGGSPESRVKKGNIFTPVPFPMSPNSAGEINDAKALSASQRKASRPNPFAKASGAASPLGSLPAPTMNSWFFLVNGSNTTSPNVLTVNGAAPNGAPNPNGGTGVGVVAMAPALSPFQLWKAVPWNGNFFLRSAQSFQTNVAESTTAFPSPLTGYGEALAFLDLGYNTVTSSLPTNSSQQVAPFWNQSASPTGDQSAFQQWSYGSNAMLQNMNTGLYIWDNNNTATMGASSPPVPDQNNTWYIYPDYFLNTVVTQANCDPPYPAWAPNATATPCAPVNNGSDAAGEQAAYDYFTSQILGSVNPQCKYEGTSYSGIRCEYIDVTANTTLGICASTAATWQLLINTLPASSNGTPISPADWSAVLSQLQYECEYAQDVQLLYQNFTNIIEAVFIDNGLQVGNLANDVGVPTSAQISAVPGQIIEGVVYTVLSAAGPVAGVFANLMETATNAVAAQPNQTITHSLQASVGSIYGDLAPAFKSLEDQTANGENTILEDWGRLSVIGPRTEISGYNGLALTATDLTTIETQAENGYDLMFLSQLIPTRYCMGMTLARDPSNSDYQTETSSLQSYNQWSYPSFGGLQPTNTNIGWFYEISGGQGSGTGVPPAQTVTNDLNQAGALSYEYLNAINLWKSECFSDQGWGPRVVVVNIYNASPADLVVYIGPNTTQGGDDYGEIAAPGYDFNPYHLPSPVGSTTSTAFELRPYGYVTLYTAGDTAYGMSGAIVDQSSPEPQVTFGISKTNDSSAPTVTVYGTQNGYQTTGIGSTATVTSGGPGGAWFTVYNPTQKP